MLKRLQRDITILVSTPYMDEANLCDRIALIQNGNIMQIDTPEQIIASYSKKLFAVKSANMHRLIQDVRGIASVYSCFGFGDYLHVTLNDNQLDIPYLTNAITQLNHQQVEVKLIQPEIEDCFMALMEHN